MKKILILLLTMSFISSNDNSTKSTLSILELQSSKVLSNFQGNELDQFNHFNQFDSLERTIIMKYDFVEGRSIQIRQIDENTFEVVSEDTSQSNNISQLDNRQSNRGISNRGLSK